MALNDAVHNPTLREVQHLIKHVEAAGPHAAASEFGWPPGMREIANAKLFLAIMKHIFAPFTATLQRRAAVPLEDWEPVNRHVQSHWRSTRPGRQVAVPALEWAGESLHAKRNEVSIGAIKDGIIEGVEE
ncbi:hypothetical protein DFH27DRAFT_529211 [Peziza echinospora]|nr:hypothetical protein DFH27DRAFT_529211 [Peziza echinospora]